MRAPLLLGLLLASPAFAQTPDANLLAQSCTACHGAALAGSGPMPRLAGRPAADLNDMLKGFKAGTRPGTIMDRLVKSMSDEELGALAQRIAQMK